MKHLSEKFTDEEYRQMKERKGDRSWREAILDEFNVNGRKEVVTGADE